MEQQPTKYIVGSKLLNLNNCKDKDVLILQLDSNDPHLYKRHFQKAPEEEDQITRSISNIDRQMNFNLGPSIDEETARIYIINYQLDEQIIGQNFPLHYNILDRRQDYINLLKYIVKNKACNFTTGFNKGHLSKYLYHVEILLCMLENNSVILTPAQLSIVQKIHDKEMPESYLLTLTKRIQELQ